MAHRAFNTTSGNFNTAANWDTVTNTPGIHAATNITVNTTGVLSATFTAPNTTNASTGCLVYIAAKPGSADLILTLFQSGVATAATVTVPNADIPPTGNWLYVRWTPFVYTTTAAGAYRVQAKFNSGSSAALAADAAGTAFSYLHTDNRNVAPTLTDDVWVCSHNGSTAVTCTVDGTAGSMGSGTETGSLASARTVGIGINIHGGGSASAVLNWDTAANSTLICKGSVYVGSGGELQMGTVATPYPTARTAKLRIDMATSGNHGVSNLDGGKIILQGAPKTFYKTTFSSGLGTAASPLITTDAVDWSVGDEILIAATGDDAANYNQTENKFIITKNSATSYVLSNTSGGGESALLYSNSSSTEIVNVTRNVVIESTDTAKATFLKGVSTTDGNINLDWARFETMGFNSTNKEGVTVVGTSTHYGSCDYCVAYRPLYRGFYFTQSRQVQTHTGLIVCNGVINANVGAVSVGSVKKRVFSDIFSLKNERVGIEVSSSYSCVFTNPRAVSNNLDNVSAASSLAGGISISNSAVIFAGAMVNCNRDRGIHLTGSNGTLFTDSNIGDIGTNVIDVNTVDSSLNVTTFSDCLFGSATLVSGYLLQLDGSFIKFHNLNQVTNNHTWYTNYGVARSTGAGLADTTVRTAGSLGIRMAPEDSTSGFTWEFSVLARANSAVSALGFLRKNAAFGSDVLRVDLYLPGSSTPDATQTMPTTTESWEVFSLASNYTGTVDGFAKVQIIGFTTTPNAYAYIDDIFNGTNNITGLEVWENGMPATIMFEQLGDASAVWAVPTSTAVSGTYGAKLKNGLTTGGFIALK